MRRRLPSRPVPCACWKARVGVEVADEIFKDGTAVPAGALNPPARAERVDGGHRVTGRVPFCRSSSHADWCTVPSPRAQSGGVGITARSGVGAVPNARCVDRGRLADPQLWTWGEHPVSPMPKCEPARGRGRAVQVLKWPRAVRALFITTEQTSGSLFQKHLKQGVPFRLRRTLRRRRKRRSGGQNP